MSDCGDTFSNLSNALKIYCIALYFHENGIFYNVYCCVSLSSVSVILYKFETIIIGDANTTQ
jgi:hypothetical protein